MNARSFKCLGRQGPQDAGHLTPSDLDHREFFLDVPLVVGEMLCKLPIKATGERRLIFGDDMFHPVGVDRFEVGQMADDLAC